MKAFYSTRPVASPFSRLVIFLGVVCAVASPTLASDKADTPVVVELFTSQGCSSCPPADAYLGELTKRNDVIALTFPVDYWDYLGWKDTFASAANTKRQRTYALRRGDRQVYTPQMVLNGRTHAVGSQHSKVEDGIARLQQKPDPDWVPIRISVKNDTVSVHAPAQPNTENRSATLWMALYTDKSSVSIRAGENSGRNVVYHHVVRQMIPLGSWSGEKLEIKLPKSDVMGPDYDGCAVLLQVNGTGPIIGAASISDWMAN